MRALTKTLRCLLLSAVVVAAFAVPASAATHRGSVLDGCAFTVSDPPVPGGSVTVEGTGFQEGADLPISVNGVVVATVHIPNGGVLPPTVIDIPGDTVYPIVISIPCSSGDGSGTATSTFGDPNTGLASTGASNTSSFVAIGLGALVVGGVLMVGARRRSAVSARKLDA